MKSRRKEKKGRLLVGLFVDYVWVSDGQETYVDLERNVLFDDGRFSAVHIIEIRSMANIVQISLF